MTHANRDKVVSVNASSDPKMLKLIQEVSKQFRQIQKTLLNAIASSFKTSYNNKDETTADPKAVGILPLHHIRTNIKVVSPCLLQTWFLPMTYRTIKDKTVQFN